MVVWLMGGKALSRRDRAARDAGILKMFLAGMGEADIAPLVGLTARSVDSVVRREMAGAAAHRDLLSDEAVAVYVHRLEALIGAAWPAAMAGDGKAIEVARRLLAQQAQFYGLSSGDVSPGSVPPLSDNQLTGPAGDDGDDELSAYRARYRRHDDDGEVAR